MSDARESSGPVSNDLPSSPPVIATQPEATEGTSSSPQTAPLSPTATLGHSSPELPSLPELPPLLGFPASAPATSGASDTSYFTASWGSPYQNPPPRSISANIGSGPEQTSQASSDIEEDSPDARFGLSHLVPSRLPTINRLAPTRPSTPSPGSPPQSPTRFPYLASSAQSIKSFFSQPKRPSVDLDRRDSNSAWNLRSGWWNSRQNSKTTGELELISSPTAEAAVEDERNVDPFQLDGTADTLARTNQLRSKGHRSRDSNLTLTQDDFWPKFTIEQGSDFRPSFAVRERSPSFDIQEALNRTRIMQASRYANLEPAVEADARAAPPKDTPKKVEAVEQDIISKVDKPSQIRTGSSEDPLALRHDPPSAVERITPPAQLQRTESASSAGRVRRTVKYRGKNVHINIPTRISGLVPLTKEEVEARLQGFEDAGHDTRGFDNWKSIHDPAGWDVRYQNRELFPNPEEDVVARRSKSYKVSVPNKALWDEYMAFLREEKLRMLGVSLGGGSESVESPATISRQGSSAQLFSPPIPTSSAGSNRHAQRASVFHFGPPPGAGAHMSRQSIASPVGAFGHMHRQSMFSPTTLPLQGMTPPIGLQSISPQLLQALTRGSPGPEGQQGRHSPMSPYGQPNGQAGFPFNQRNELLVQMQRQKEQQIATQIQQAAAMQKMLSQSAGSGAARPPSTLQEVPEAEEDDEFGRPQLRSRQGEAPEIVNPKPSHRHNISVKLEEGISRNSDYHLERSIDKEMDEENEEVEEVPKLPPRTTSLKATNGALAPTAAPSAKQQIFGTASAKKDNENDENVAPPTTFGKASGAEAANPWANDPTFFSKPKNPPTSQPTHFSHHSSKSSVSGLNVAAKEFNPSSFVPNGNPSASFNPGIFSASAFSFTPASKPKDRTASGRKSISPSPQSFRSSFNAAAPAFNPGAESFTPGAFSGFGSSTNSSFPSFGHDRTPPMTLGMALGQSEFNFSAGGPSFEPRVPALKPTASAEHPDSPSPAHLNQSIFGKIDTSAEGKRAKKSKAIPIVHPEEGESRTPPNEEDEEGRIKQSADRMKRAKTVDSDSENEPLFAPIPDQGTQLPLPPVTLKSNATAEDVKNAVEAENAAIEELAEKTSIEDVPAEIVEDTSELPTQFTFVSETGKDEPEAEEIKASPASPASSAQELTVPNDLGSSTKETESGSTSRVFSNSSTLSAAAPAFDFKPSFTIDEGLKNRMASHLHAMSKDSAKASPVIAQTPSDRSASSLSKTAADEDEAVSEEGEIREIDRLRERLPASVRYFDDETDQPSFQEIDAVMQHINAASDDGIEREVQVDDHSWPNSSSPQFDVSPLPSSPAPPPRFNLPVRSDAPSPSPRRPMITRTLNSVSPSITQDPFSDGRAVPGYDSPIRRLNASEEAPASDWDDVVSSGQENEFRQKAEFFGPHVSSLIETTMDRHFLAMEKKVADLIEAQVGRRHSSRRARSRPVDSDADDEDDDVETDAYSRGFSPKRDRRMEKMRTIIQEAFAAQRPRTPQLVQDSSHFEDLHKAIANIQESVIAQRAEVAAPVAPMPAAPTLDEIKALIEESVAAQNEALVKRREEAIRAEDEERFHEFADRLREAATRIAEATEAQAEAERREAETNRLLKVTEEELERYKEIDEERTAKLEHHEEVERKGLEFKHLLKVTEEELELLKQVAKEDAAKVKALEAAAESARALHSGKDDAQADLSKKLMDLSLDNENLRETLEEYRLSSDKWRHDLEEANAEREKVHHAFGALKIQAEEALRIRETMRSRIEKLQDDMNHAVSQVAAERAKWTRSDAEQKTRYEILAARAEAEARTRERFEREVERLESQERESFKLRAALEHEQKQNVKLDNECRRLDQALKDTSAMKMELVQYQKENNRLQEEIEHLKNEASEHQRLAEQYAKEFREAREAGRLEVDRTRGLMQIDIDTAKNEVNIVRFDMEAEITRMRVEMDNLKLENDALKAKHELDMEDAEERKQNSLRELTEAKDAVFRELRDTFEERLEGLRKQHRRDLDHTIENKNQSESFLRDSHATILQDLQDHHERTIEQTLNEKEFTEGQLNERLSLANSKIEHLEDKIQHLEEKLEITKSAAAAAAQAARSAKSPVQTHASTFPAPTPAAQFSAPAPVASHAPAQPRLPEKISPQALRESIAVLQEQLQERESRIESLEQELGEVDKEAPAKLKAKDTEIGWLRELIGVRVDDLSDLVTMLSRENFNREAARNAAIRIKASIQMEQDAKERQANGAASITIPSLAQIQDFASPKAAQLSAALSRWRKGGGGMVSSNLAESASSVSSSRTQTPSRVPAAATTAQNFLNGLMTPPASSLRKTPSPDPSISRPRPLGSSHAGPPRPLGGARGLEKRRMSRESETSAVPSTPPFLKDEEFDDDAEESTGGYYDDEDGSTVEEGTPRRGRTGSFGIGVAR